jgi:hypothetical protein
VDNRIVVEKIVQILAYEKIADSSCSAATIRRRRDEWIDAGIFSHVEQIAVDGYNKMIGLDLSDVAVDGRGIPLGTVVAAANRHDSPLLRPTLEKLNRFAELPEKITVHLDAGYDSRTTWELLDEFGCEGQIATKGKPVPLQATGRWPVERTNSWHNRGFRKLAICTEVRTRVIDAFIALANTIIIVRRLIRQGWTRCRWDGRPHNRP